LLSVFRFSAHSERGEVMGDVFSIWGSEF
jgi:hypothetical protein